MLKSFFSVLFISTLLFCSSKPVGCELAQYGDVWLSIGSREYTKVSYTPIAKSGRNFYAILVGSILSTGNVSLKIIDIKADKKKLNHRRVGNLRVSLKKDGFIEVVNMRYSYFKGYFSADGLDKKSNKIGFDLHIKALLCSGKS